MSVQKGCYFTEIGLRSRKIFNVVLNVYTQRSGASARIDEDACNRDAGAATLPRGQRQPASGCQRLNDGYRPRRALAL
jgi:hypothetical protein